MITLYMTSGGGAREIFCTCDTEEEAMEIGNLYGWHYTDENGFDWYLEF